MAIKGVRTQRPATHSKQMADRGGAEHAEPHPRQAIGLHVDRHGGIALDDRGDDIDRGRAFLEDAEPGAAETDIVHPPLRQFRDPCQRRDMLEMAERDQGEKPVLGLPVKNHGPAGGFDAIRGDFTEPGQRTPSGGLK